MTIVPPDALPEDVLTRLIEEFVTRSGTDLAEAKDKIAHVRRQLASGHVQIVWDEETESANIVPKDYKPPAPSPRAPKARKGPEITYDEPPPPDWD